MFLETLYTLQYLLMKEEYVWHHKMVAWHHLKQIWHFWIIIHFVIHLD